MKASAGAEACVIERLSSKYEVWSSNPSTAKKKKAELFSDHWRWENQLPVGPYYVKT
jgi:hypothetical protein